MNGIALHARCWLTHPVLRTTEDGLPVIIVLISCLFQL